MSLLSQDLQDKIAYIHGDTLINKSPVIADDVSGGGTGSNNKITYANLLSKAPDGSASLPSFSFNSCLLYTSPSPRD